MTTNRHELSNKQRALLELVKAGLFGHTDSTESTEKFSWASVDWGEVYRLAEEQSVIGLVAAGIENLNANHNLKVPQEWALQFIGQTLQIEQRNKAMNGFVEELIAKLRKEDVYCLLVKGQGVAQCYDKPLWRCSGDIDLLLSEDNYKMAKNILIPLADEVANEDERSKHLAMVIKGFDVELHGRMPFSLSKRVGRGVDNVLDDLFCRGNVRSWDCNGTQVFLPSPDNDVILVFTHFLHHFFIEGVGLRQICDWCRLMWTYRDSLNYGILESRIRKAGLVSEWKAFYNLASRYLGMPDLDSSFMFQDSRFDKKANRIMELVMEAGNFGHNKDLSYRTKYKGLTYKIVSLWRRMVDFARFVPIFPLDAPRFFVGYVFGKVKG